MARQKQAGNTDEAVEGTRGQTEKPKKKPDPRRHRQASLTPDAMLGWDTLCALHHCTFTALMEALGLLALSQGDWLDPNIAEMARTIDRTRLSR